MDHGEPSMSDVQRQDCEGKGALIAWQAKVGAESSAERAVRLETERQGIVALITQELSGAWAACGAFEWIALGYLAFSCVLIAAFAENLAHPVKLIGAQAFVAAVILVLCRVETRAAAWRAWNKEKQRGTDRNVCPTVAQKFLHFCTTVGQTFLSVPLCFSLFQALHAAARVSTRHKTKMTAATNACAPINFTGCAKFSANTAIKTLENARYPSAIHSNAPQAAHAPANSHVISATIPCRSVSSLTARSPLPSVPTFARQAINAPFPSQSCRCTSLIEGSPCSPVPFSSLFVLTE